MPRYHRFQLYVVIFADKIFCDTIKILRLLMRSHSDCFLFQIKSLKLFMLCWKPLAMSPHPSIIMRQGSLCYLAWILTLQAFWQALQSRSVRTLDFDLSEEMKYVILCIMMCQEQQWNLVKLILHLLLKCHINHCSLKLLKPQTKVGHYAVKCSVLLPHKEKSTHFLGYWKTHMS